MRELRPESIRSRVRQLALPIVACLVIALRFSGAMAGDSPANPAAQKEAVRTLLRHRCAKCHGPLNSKARLNLSTLRGLARGGENGAAVVAGRADASLLWQRVSADEMPPDDPLLPEDKALLRSWIEAGAPGLPTGDLGPIVGADHWAFQPLAVATAPDVRNSDRIRTVIDRYVQAPLEERGLTLGTDADARTLIRRVAITLTGLPPTPEEVAAFIADVTPGSYERMVERYLASLRYGERWGKHWLDAVGYADSNGYFSADTDRPWAFRYRDYVIQSFNADKPLDRFVCEQLAGDEMTTFRANEPTTPETMELLIATHFLRNGQDGTDIGVQEPEAFEIDRRAALEAVVQVTSSSLLGMTVHCARCHDHKFEPIKQTEYYQLQAVMFPAFNPQDWVNPQDRIAYAYLPGEKETWEANEKRLTQAIASLTAEFKEWQAANREPSELLLSETFDDGWPSRWSNTAPGDDAPGGKLTIEGAAANSARTRNAQLQVVCGPNEAWLSTKTAIDWTPNAPGDWIQATFDLVSDQVDSPTAMRIGYSIAVHDFNGSAGRPGGNLLIDGNPTEATTVYGDYPGGSKNPRGSIGQQGYVPGRNYGVRVTHQEADQYLLEHLVDGISDGKSIELKASDLPDGGFAFFYSASRSYVVDNVRVERNLPDSGKRSEITALRQQLRDKRTSYEKQRAELEKQRSKAPGRAIAWVTDKSAVPPTVPFLKRGLYTERGASVEPAALSILTDAGHEFRPEPRAGEPKTTGRRLGFAKWLTRADGRPAALMARTYVNRFWQQYFGRGIVTTTDNLGLGGAPPTHPELLDYLAASLIRHGWSIKDLHRELVTSTVYRQTSTPRTDGVAADPDDRYLWRYPVRRLQAEVIRDAMLAVTGELDSTPYGPYVPTKQTPIGEVIADKSESGSRRRSVYLQQRRSQTLSMLKVFDAPAVATICTARPSSTVPLQSLALLNSDFSVTCGDALARRLRAETDGTAKQLVRRAWQLAMARDPTDAEVSLALEFLAGQEKQYSVEETQQKAVADFCQMLLASNSFLYVE